MDINRRDALLLGTRAITGAIAGAAAVAALPVPVLAAENGMQAVIDAFTGGAPVADGGIEIDAPEIAENGNNVPVEVMAEGASAILLVASGNPNPGVATFNFGKLSAASGAKTRIRLATTQDVVAVARLADGGYAKAARTVKVTIGGCGG